ncbi:hypothetical protein CANINC_001417 [Pichia inconspicua]|uniref:Conserved oligomeric Golgi complex subunit 3 n=1 Tax=Pichia inconspicua TaxID=52247 RepID=A0A4T0X3H2_9ASCO|nr:hypothetical protein CANINC_001417 [[Candida] inconspicua]
MVRARSRSFTLDESILAVPATDVVVDHLYIDEYQDFTEFLRQTKNQNNEFITHINSTIDSLDKLLAIHDSVIMQTTDFQSESTTLIESLTHLDELHKSLTAKFNVFRSLDYIVKKLNTVNNTKIVLKPSFHDLLNQLDNALEFVNNPAHSEYKDITVYQHRFKQCMIRALTLIRNYIINYIKSTEKKIVSQIKPQTADALLNVTFVDSLASVFPIFLELYKRTTPSDIDNKDSDEDYFNLLDDVYNQYSKTRGQLVNTHIVHPFLASTKFDQPIVEFTNTNLNFFIKLIDKETEVFKSVFFLPPPAADNTTNATAVTSYLEQLLDPLYYLLRNRILRETDIDNCCELINLITSFTTHAPLLRPILHDAQTRLVFRVQKYLDEHITWYKRTGQELVITKDSKLVYPPVLDAVDILNKIYGLLNAAVFDDIASNAVHMCIESLNAFVEDKVEYQLYAIKSLLLLKETIHSFDIIHFRRETTLDFSRLKTILSKTGSVYDKLVGSLPKVVSEVVDVHVELQVTIRAAVHRFIEIAVSRVNENASIAEIKRLYSQITEFVDDETTTILMDGVQEELGPQFHDTWVAGVREAMMTHQSVDTGIDTDANSQQLMDEIQNDLDNMSM